MKEISLHILDIVHNSITAGADLIEVTVVEDKKEDILSFEVSDNGKGMSQEVLKKVIDPFTTHRTTRKVGLGIPLTKLACEVSGGSFEITSKLGIGTKVKAVFGYSNIDRQPLGDMAQTMHQLITSFEDIDFLYTHKIGDKEFVADTKSIKEVLGGVSLRENEISLWLMDYLAEAENEINQ